jgi:hypothetical protein
VLDLPGAAAAIQAAGDDDAQKQGTAGLITAEGHMDPGGQAAPRGDSGDKAIGQSQQQGSLQQGLQGEKGRIVKKGYVPTLKWLHTPFKLRSGQPIRL